MLPDGKNGDAAAGDAQDVAAVLGGAGGQIGANAWLRGGADTGTAVGSPVMGGEGNAVPDAATGSAGEPSVGGAAGAPSCAETRVLRVRIDADTWIQEDEPKARHGSDAQLFVVSGSAERRALFSLTLPSLPAGAVLERATFVLHLEADADRLELSRTLALRRLQQSFDEMHASWSNYDNGKAAWAQAGGDLGAELAPTVTIAGPASEQVSFDMTRRLDRILGGAPLPLSLIVLETSASPSFPGEFVFASTEGTATDAPLLVLEYCAP